MEQQLSHITQAVVPALASHAAPCEAAPPAACSTEIPPSTDISYPDSGFQSTSGQHSATGDSFLSSGTTDSLKTVRAASPAQSGFASDSADCSLLEQYLSSIQQREEEEEEAEDVASDRTDTPQPSSPLPSSKKHSATSPLQNAGDNRSEAPPTEEPAPDAGATL